MVSGVEESYGESYAGNAGYSQRGRGVGGPNSEKDQQPEYTKFYALN